MRGWPQASLILLLSCAEADTGGLLPGPLPNPNDGGTPQPSDSGVPTTSPDSGVPVGPGPEAETFKSGTRLRAVVLDAGGGARSFQYWYDTTLGVECTFEYAWDGEVYCLPLGRPADRFRDLNCQEPVAVVDDCSRGDTYFRSVPAWEGQVNQCGYDRLDRGRWLEIFRAIGTARVDQLQYGAGEACYVERVPDQEIFLLEPAPLTSFVRGAVALQDRGLMLGVWRVLAEDGAEEDLAMVDLSRNQECDPVLGLDQCAPNSALTYVREDLFARGCAQSLAGGTSNPGCQPELALEWELPSGPLCSRGAARLRTLAEPYSGPVYRNDEGQCQPREGLSPSGLFTVGPLVNRLYFPAVERRRVGSGGLQVERYFSSSLNPLPSYESVFDVRTGNRCELAPDENDPGASACLNPEEIAGAYLAYADPGCQLPLGVQWLYDNLGCQEQPRSLVLIGPRPSLGRWCATGPTRLFEVGPPHQGPVYTTNWQGRCEPLDLTTPQGFRVYPHQLGAQRSLEGYPRVRQIIE